MMQLGSIVGLYIGSTKQLSLRLTTQSLPYYVIKVFYAHICKI